MKRLAIICTHPIQYYAPIFKLMHERNKLKIKVFYTLGENNLNTFDPGFNKQICWDIPLLEGYNFQFEKNNAKNPNSQSFWGIKTPKLIQNIMDWQADALLVFGWAYQSHLKSVIYFKNKIPIFFRGDSTLFNKKNSLKNSIKIFLLRLIYKHVDHAFYVGENSKAYYKKLGLKNEKLSFAPHSIDNKRFAENQFVKATALREKLGVGAEEILILFAGKLEPVKNPFFLLNTFEKLDQQNCHLVFVGNGPLEIALKAQKTGLKTASKVHFLDFQNQLAMPSIYQSCDLFCLPSKSETWGLAVNEAMAAGKAILVSNQVGCAVDLVFEGKNGAVFQSENEADLVHKLQQLCQKSLLKTYGAASAQIIESWNFDHTVTAMQDKILSYV